jgi:hypothetical protein
MLPNLQGKGVSSSKEVLAPGSIPYMMAFSALVRESASGVVQDKRGKVVPGSTITIFVYGAYQLDMTVSSTGAVTLTPTGTFNYDITYRVV